jgi:hypothetical protein
MKNMYVMVKDNLIEHFDYVAVTPDVWAFLRAWYDFDFSLLRYIKRDKMNPDKLQLVLYPERKLVDGMNETIKA